ncbi:MAG: hypothetical protein AB7G65_19365 [Thermoleophilia bacterium]
MTPTRHTDGFGSGDDPLRFVDDPRRFWGLVLGTLAAVVLTFAIAIFALVQSSGADERALQRVDGGLRGFGADVEARRGFARYAEEALAVELAKDGSAGPRDCTGDGIVTAVDYLPGQGPLPLITRNGLTRGAHP